MASKCRYTFEALDEFLGKGSYGAVYTFKENSKSDIVAIKCIENDTLNGHHFATVAKKEFEALKRVQGHKNIVTFNDFQCDKKFIYISMEFCDLGDLRKFLPKRNPDMTQKLKMMSECASAVSYMHNLTEPVVHRDITLGNILLKSSDTGPIVKVTDFGLAKVLGPEQIYLKTDTGTPAFRAPELFGEPKKLQYTSSVDTFSLGLVYFVITTFSFDNYRQNGNDALLPIPTSLIGKPFLPYGQHLYQARKGDAEIQLFDNEPGGDQALLADIKRLILNMTHTVSEKRLPMKDVESKLEKIISQMTKDIKSRKLKLVTKQEFRLTPQNPESDLNAVNIGLPHNPDSIKTDLEELCGSSWSTVTDGDLEATSRILSEMLMMMYEEARATYAALLKKISERKSVDPNAVRILHDLTKERNETRKMNVKHPHFHKYKEIFDAMRDPFFKSDQEMYTEVDSDLERELRRYLLMNGGKTPLHDYGDHLKVLEKIKSTLDPNSMQTELAKLLKSSAWPKFCEKSARLIWYIVLQQPLMFIELTNIGKIWDPQFKKFSELECVSKSHSDAVISYYTQPVLYRGGEMTYDGLTPKHSGGEVLLKGMAVLQ